MTEPLKYRVTLDTDFIIEKDGVRVELEWDASLVRLLADPPRDAKITLRDNETGQEIVWPLGSRTADNYPPGAADLGAPEVADAAPEGE